MAESTGKKGKQKCSSVRVESGYISEGGEGNCWAGKNESAVTEVKRSGIALKGEKKAQKVV